MVDTGRIHIWAPRTGLDFLSRLGEGTPNVQGGGGWQVIGRPRRTGLTDWAGRDPLRVIVPFLIDSWSENQGREVELQLRDLEKMAGIATGPDAPPLVRFNTNGVVQYDHTSNPKMDWVIEDISWSDALRNQRGNRVRQAGSITFLRFVRDERLEKVRAKARARRKAGKDKGKHGHKKFYIVRKGDTLAKIAARVLGDASEWHKIARLNKIRDPKSIKVGQKLKMP